ncbi:MAG TPA: sulfotransferase [Candidatus Hydrogenedentes bacterium]|nr:sulfotransferase [Candidatus Hydrogenedentota bacterium]HPG67101.1 sulfotransferase [Candidatus Hydrogenedentota bacterium]
MSVKMLFVIGAPRSGTTMLERMLASHSMILGGPEPHLLTPLAHLGIWDKVDKAPYDHILAAQSQKEFVEALPNKEQDYWEACRAYCDVLYGRYLSTSNKQICMDKTPAYSLVVPFIMKVFPDAKYVILTRHPMAIFSSFANSFFDGRYDVAQEHNPILNRYVPALADAIRQQEVPVIHVRYEHLVKDPETWMEKICAYCEIPFEKDAIDYGKKDKDEPERKGLGDPIGVKQHSRPSTGSLKKWVQELSSDPKKLELMKKVVAQLDPADLETLGYPIETFWKPLEEAAGTIAPPAKPKLDRYRLERKMIITLRGQAQKGGAFRKLVKKAQLACDVILRE